MHFTFTGLKKMNIFLLSLFGKSQIHFTDKQTGSWKDSVTEIKFDLKSSYVNSYSYQTAKNSEEVLTSEKLQIVLHSSQGEITRMSKTFNSH